jgi:hypothetical protein
MLGKTSSLISEVIMAFLFPASLCIRAEAGLYRAVLYPVLRTALLLNTPISNALARERRSVCENFSLKVRGDPSCVIAR